MKIAEKMLIKKKGDLALIVIKTCYKTLVIRCAILAQEEINQQKRM